MADYTWAAFGNSISTTITEAMTASAPGNGGTLNISSETNVPAKGYALIDNELIQYASVTTGQITLAAAGARGSGGTTAASHSNGAVIKFSVLPAAVINEIRAQSPTVLFSEQGDIMYASAASTPVALHHGSAGDYLKSGGHASIPAWATNVGEILGVFDGGGAVLTTGIKGDVVVPFGCTITQATLLADQSGSIVFGIWKNVYASFPPTAANSICSTTPPTIANNIKAQDSTLTGWTSVIAAGDVLRFNIDSISSIQRVTLGLKVSKT